MLCHSPRDVHGAGYTYYNCSDGVAIVTDFNGNVKRNLKRNRPARIQKVKERKKGITVPGGDGGHWGLLLRSVRILHFLALLKEVDETLQAAGVPGIFYR